MLVPDNVCTIPVLRGCILYIQKVYWNAKLKFSIVTTEPFKLLPYSK
jgi:hypothetical protein